MGCPTAAPRARAWGDGVYHRLRPSPPAPQLLRQVHQPRLLKAAEAELRFAVDGGYKPMFGKRKKLAIVPPQGGCWAAPSNPRRPP